MSIGDKSEFIEDWNAMVATVARFSKKYDLPPGELVFQPIVLDTLRDLTREYLLDTFVANGIRTRFGRFEQMDVLRSG